MYVLMTVCFPTLFPGTDELFKLDLQTFSDGEILRRLTLFVSSVLNMISSIGVYHLEESVRVY